MTALERRSYSGNAPQATLAGDINASVLTFSVADGTGFPDGTAGPFFVVIDRGKTSEEKIHVVSRSFGTFTADQRGADGTSASSHSFGATVEHCLTATDADEANNAAHQTLGQISEKGDLLIGTGGNTLGVLAAGPDGSTLIADSTQPTGYRFGTPGAATQTDVTDLIVVTGNTYTSESNAGPTSPLITVGTSGQLEVTVSALVACLSDPPNTQHTGWITPQLLNSSGGSVVAAADVNGATTQQAGTGGTTVQRTTIFGGLTVGAQYQVRCWYRSDASGSNSFANRRVVVRAL